MRDNIWKVSNWAVMYQQHNSDEHQGAEHKNDLQEKEAPHSQTAFASELFFHNHLKQGMLWMCHVPDGHGPRQQNFSRWGGVLTDLMHGLLLWNQGVKQRGKGFQVHQIFCPGNALHVSSSHFLLHVWLRMAKPNISHCHRVRAGRFRTKKPHHGWGYVTYWIAFQFLKDGWDYSSMMV